MNAESLDSIQWRYATLDDGKKNLIGLSMKEFIFYALKTKDFGLCRYIRNKLMGLQYPNLIIVDEHETMWKVLGKNPYSWPLFFSFYASMAEMTSKYCSVLISCCQYQYFGRFYAK